MKLRPLRDQVIVITGASSGIGLATARAAARRGACVVINSRDDVDLPRAADAIRADGGEVAFDVGDVADLAAVQRLAQTAVRAFGRFDTWVNNAGVSIYGPIADVSLEDAHRLFATNFWGVVHGSLVAAAFFRQRDEVYGAALINVGSILSEIGYPLQGYYAASKHAVKGFTDSLRLELEREEVPVSVSLIEPTAVDTPHPEHARNYLLTEPTHALPVYAPEVVAGAILECAEHPHHTLRVGGGAKLLSELEKFAPSLAGWPLRRAFERQRTSEPLRDDDTLWSPRPNDASERGSYAGHVMRSSAYTSMAQRRGPVVLGLTALGVGLGLAWRNLLRERAD